MSKRTKEFIGGLVAALVLGGLLGTVIDLFIQFINYLIKEGAL